ncbi:MAG: NUDIX hydrolase [Pseudonocardiaceae bacterium]
MANPRPPIAPEPTRWTIHGERLVDETWRLRLSIARVELPDGVHFEQYVLRMPKAAMTVLLDGAGERVLMIWRHRFVLDRRAWELPGGYVDVDENPTVTAAREVEEETGWRPHNMTLLTRFQPLVGTADFENLIFLGEGAEDTGTAGSAWNGVSRRDRSARSASVRADRTSEAIRSAARPVSQAFFDLALVSQHRGEQRQVEQPTPVVAVDHVQRASCEPLGLGRTSQIAEAAAELRGQVGAVEVGKPFRAVPVLRSREGLFGLAKGGQASAHIVRQCEPVCFHDRRRRDQYQHARPLAVVLGSLARSMASAGKRRNAA